MNAPFSSLDIDLLPAGLHMHEVPCLVSNANVYFGSFASRVWNWNQPRLFPLNVCLYKLVGSWDTALLQPKNFLDNKGCLMLPPMERGAFIAGDAGSKVCQKKQESQGE